MVFTFTPNAQTINFLEIFIVCEPTLKKLFLRIPFFDFTQIKSSTQFHCLKYNLSCNKTYL